MLRVCSFLPAATQMIYDLGLQDMLCGVTFECPPQALKEKKKVVRCVLEGKSYSSEEIDRIFSTSVADGKSLYYVDEEVLQEIAPDIIFTQDVCEVCQIDTACTARAVAKLKKQPLLIPLTPQTLSDVFGTVMMIAKAHHHEERGAQHLASLQKRIDHVIDLQRKHRVMPVRAMLMEWTDPIYNCGHWIPYQVAMAGGIDMLSNPGGDSVVTSWEKILKYDPEVLVIAPCGFHVERTLQEIHTLTDRAGWGNMTAVKHRQVYVADFDLFTQPSASTLVDGIEVLAKMFHPEVISIALPLKSKFTRLYENKVAL